MKSIKRVRAASVTVFLTSAALLPACGSPTPEVAPAPAKAASTPVAAAPAEMPPARSPSPVASNAAKQTSAAPPVAPPVETGPCALESNRVDARRVADPKARQAVEAIEEKLNAITACTFTVHTVDTLAMVDGPALEERSEAACNYRWPCDFAVTTRYRAHGTPGMVGTIHEMRTNGTELWDVTLGTEESRAALEALRLSDRARGALLARQANPYVKVSTLAKLLAVSDPGLALTDMLHWLRAPFAHCDVPTLRLEAADENGWIFNARPAAPLQREFDRVRVWVDAATGVAVETTLFRPAGGGRRVKTITDVNTQPVLADADFAYSIPEGAVLAGDS